MTAEPTPPAAPGQNTTVRNILLGIIAALIGVLLVAVGFLGRVITEPESTIIPAAPADNGAASADNGDTSRPAASSEADFLILDEILQILEQDFVEPDRVDPEYLHSAAINGIFEALDDPHSTYIDPETYSLNRDDFSGAFQGIGATVDKPEGSDYIIIVRPLPETPAEAAGLVAGDQIVEVNGEDAFGWSVQEGVLKIRGPQGTPVDLKIRHADGSEEVITIVRDEIHVASVSALPPGGSLVDSEGNEVTDIAYIRILSFTRRTPEELQTLIDEANASGARGIILDVRSNPGGLLVETIEVADMFLDSGEIVTEVDRDGNEQTASARPGTLTDLPIVVLQDDFSASGSELLAAALQENDRALVVGTNSFGKGTVNHVRELSNGGAVYVSIARWLTPDHNQIEGLGITPDIVVEFTIEDIDAGRDVQTERAIEVLRELADQASVSSPASSAS